MVHLLVQRQAGDFAAQGRIGVAASTLYAKNLLTFLTTFWDKDAKAPKLPETDDIIKGVMLTRGGAIVHPSFLPSQAA